MRLCKLALVLGAVALLASPALAQQPGRGFPGMGGMGQNAAMLIQFNKGLQDELKVDQDQLTKIREATTKVREDFRDEFAKLRDAKPEEREAIMKKLGEANEKAVVGCLKEDQVKRFNQIQLQLKGIAMFTDEKVQKELKLNDEQKEKIKEIAKDLDKERTALMPRFEPGVKPDFSKLQENMQKIQSLEKEAKANATKVLNADQKKQVKEMTGEPFELKIEFGRPGGKPDKPRTDF
jgi:hypothetical protein